MNLNSPCEIGTTFVRLVYDNFHHMAIKKVRSYIKYIAVAVYLTFGTSCSQDVPDAVFEMPFENLRFTIPAGISQFDAHFFIIRDIRLNMDFFLDQGGVSDPSRVRIIPATARLTQFQSAVDLEFIERISVQMFTPTNSNLNLEIFFRDPIPFRNGPGLNLVPNIIELQDYTEDDEINLRIRMQLRYPPPEFVEVNLDFVLRGEEID